MMAKKCELYVAEHWHVHSTHTTLPTQSLSTLAGNNSQTIKVSIVYNQKAIHTL